MQIGSPVWIPGTRNFLATARKFGAPPRSPDEPLNYQSAKEAQTFIGVWSIDDDGDVAPRYTIGHDIFKELRNLAIDAKHKTVMAADKTNNDITTFDFHEAWNPISPETAPRYIQPRGRGQGAHLRAMLFDGAVLRCARGINRGRILSRLIRAYVNSFHLP